MQIEVQWASQNHAPTWPSRGGVNDDDAIGHRGADLDPDVLWAVEQGARLADHEPQDDVRVMIDPDGHPFCLFPDDTSRPSVAKPSS